LNNEFLTLGSLFDGSGTLPLAARMLGITPVWASEIELYPISVTKKNFPEMKHVGSILDLNGAELPPVDIICGGSPCQDLSVAGKQKGLIEGERSNLFFEMTRVIREMRAATNGTRCRFIIWENVPGAFSSNSGMDFYAVLQNYASLADPAFTVPLPPAKNGKLIWPKFGEVIGSGWSIAYRTVDAQYWGVPQRRRRIWLVMDFASEHAGKILFDEDGVWTTGEAPHEPVVTKLSDILQQDADPKYKLSAKACQGILNRAERRGKVLPDMLKEALEEVVGDKVIEQYPTDEDWAMASLFTRRAPADEDTDDED